MNSPEEYENLISLMSQTLKFYADERNYVGAIDLDNGSQARFALDMAKKLEETLQKAQDDYDKLILEAESMESDGETNPIELIRIFKETHND